MTISKYNILVTIVFQLQHFRELHQDESSDYLDYNWRAPQPLKQRKVHRSFAIQPLGGFAGGASPSEYITAALLMVNFVALKYTA